MIKLMNSAVMPQEGIYLARKVNEAVVRMYFQKHKDEGWESYVGYPQNIPYMSSVLGEEIPVNRSETKLEHNDVMIVCKLKYRIADPKEKINTEPQPEDFEWYIITYKTHWDGKADE